MNRILVLVVACSMLLGADIHRTYTPEAEVFVDHSVIIQAGAKGSEIWQTIGSGVAIGEQGHLGILTARHVGKDADLLRYCAMVEPTHCQEISHYHHKNLSTDTIEDDWKIYPVDTLPDGLVPVNTYEFAPLIGEPIWITGCPGAYPAVQHAFLMGRGVYDHPDVPIVSASIAPGASGGPVFTDDGKLIGLVVANPPVSMSIEDIAYRLTSAGIVMPINSLMLKDY